MAPAGLRCTGWLPLQRSHDVQRHCADCQLVPPVTVGRCSLSPALHHLGSSSAVDQATMSARHVIASLALIKAAISVASAQPIQVERVEVQASSDAGIEKGATPGHERGARDQNYHNDAREDLHLQHHGQGEYRRVRATTSIRAGRASVERQHSAPPL